MRVQALRSGWVGVGGREDGRGREKMGGLSARSDRAPYQKSAEVFVHAIYGIKVLSVAFVARGGRGPLHCGDSCLPQATRMLWKPRPHAYIQSMEHVSRVYRFKLCHDGGPVYRDTVTEIRKFRRTTVMPKLVVYQATPRLVFYHPRLTCDTLLLSPRGLRSRDANVSSPTFFWPSRSGAVRDLHLVSASI